MVDEQFVILKEDEKMKEIIDAQVANERRLSDKTRIGMYTWGILKTFAMVPGY